MEPFSRRSRSSPPSATATSRSNPGRAPHADDEHQIRIALGGELDPGLVRPLTGDDYIGVVMPMRI
jgi:hypothetical protein